MYHHASLGWQRMTPSPKRLLHPKQRMDSFTPKRHSIAQDPRDTTRAACTTGKDSSCPHYHANRASRTSRLQENWVNKLQVRHRRRAMEFDRIYLDASYTGRSSKRPS